MNRRIIITTCLTIAVCLCSAQDAKVTKAAKSVFTLTTFKADGSIIATTHGVYCGDNGDAISAFQPFVGANSAAIIDASGKKYDVEAIYGANSMYDICRFRVSSKSTSPLPMAQNPAADKAYAVGYSTKKADIKALTLKSTETFKDKYTYYIFNEEISEETEGCPIVNANGELIGLVQRSSTSYDIHSTDARFYSELISSGLSSQDPALQKTAIRTALPTDFQQAQLMLMMFDSNTDSANVVNTVNEFSDLFPGEIDGYSALARYHSARGNIGAATQAMENALKNAKSKEDAYFEYAKQMYNYCIYNTDSLQTRWTLDKAAELLSNAIAISAQPSYSHLLAQIKYSQADYSGALKLFEEISTSNIANSEVFYEIAQCKSQLGMDGKEILESLNQAVDRCPKPLTNISAPYILARGIALETSGENRAALKDYQTYDSLMNYNASPQFYYTRYKCEVKMRQYQPAINDISHAIVLNPAEVTYMAELASLQLKVGKYEDVLRTFDLSLNVTDNYPDMYILKGVALIHLGRKQEAMEAFQKAADLGDSRGNEYQEKYK